MTRAEGSTLLRFAPQEAVGGENEDYLESAGFCSCGTQVFPSGTERPATHPLGASTSNPIWQKRGRPKLSRQSPARPNSVHKSGYNIAEEGCRDQSVGSVKHLNLSNFEQSPSRPRCNLSADMKELCRPTGSFCSSGGAAVYLYTEK